MSRRVVVTGMGVVSPNGVGLEADELGLRGGESGIRHFAGPGELKFGCRVRGVPQGGEGGGGGGLLGAEPSGPLIDGGGQRRIGGQSGGRPSHVRMQWSRLRARKIRSSVPCPGSNRPRLRDPSANSPVGTWGLGWSRSRASEHTRPVAAP